MPSIDCPHRQGDMCLQAELLAGLPVITTDKACEVCLEQSDRTNHVTASLALNVLPKPIQTEKQYLYNLLKTENLEPAPTQGPGTELKKLVEWFVWSKNIRNCKTCRTREERMNRWGPDVCKKNIQTIIGWLRESAAQHGYPFSERVAAALIRKAIDNSRK